MQPDDDELDKFVIYSIRLPQYDENRYSYDYEVESVEIGELPNFISNKMKDFVDNNEESVLITEECGANYLNFKDKNLAYKEIKKIKLELI